MHAPLAPCVVPFLPLARCLPIAKRPNLALHFASIGHPASGCCMPPPEQPVPDNVSAPPSLDKPLDSAAVSATVRRQRLAEAAAAMSHADEPPLAHQGVRFTEDGTSPRPVRVVGLDALRNGELRGSQALVDEDVSPCSRVSSGEVSAGSAASPFRNARRLRPTVAHRSPPEPAAAGTSPASFFTRFGELRAPRSTLAMAVLTMAILAMAVLTLAILAMARQPLAHRTQHAQQVVARLPNRRTQACTQGAMSLL